VAGDAPLSVQFVADYGDPDGVVVARRWRLPDGTVVENDDPKRTFTSVGTFVARLEVTDNHGLVSSDTVTVAVTRNGALPPRILSEAELLASAGEPYHYDGDDRVVARGTPPLTFELGRLIDGQLNGVPQGMTLDAATGRLWWTPSAEQSGEHEVSIRVSNSAGIDVQSFVVSVAAGPDGRPPACGCGTSESAGGGMLLALASIARALSRRRWGAAARLALVKPPRPSPPPAPGRRSAPSARTASRRCPSACSRTRR
jgi:hypothetical protein